jgi:hypothetical protein
MTACPINGYSVGEGIRYEKEAGGGRGPGKALSRAFHGPITHDVVPRGYAYDQAHTCRGATMKVLDESGHGVEPGSKVNLADYGLPVNATNGLLIVFWKSL